MEENLIIIRKVPLDMLLGLLSDLYEQGVDYVDLMGKSGDRQDNIGISFQQEYMADESVDATKIKYPEIKFKPAPEPPRQIDPPTNFNEEDLNSLI